MAPTKKQVKPKKASKPRSKRMITKDIGGEKNGGKRVVRVNRMVRTYVQEIMLISKIPVSKKYAISSL